MTEEKEIWKDIPGSPGYQASSFGRIRSVRRVVKRIVKGVESHMICKGRILVPFITKWGYASVRLGRGKRNELVGWLVLKAFVGPRPPNHDMRHFPDRSKTNCRLDNLSWATRKINFADKILHGTLTEGELHPHSKFNRKQINKIRRMRKRGCSYERIMKYVVKTTGGRVSLSTLHDIVHKKTYRFRVGI